MTKNLYQLSFIVLVLVVYVLCPPIKAQTNLSGEWKAQIKSENPKKIYLSFERNTNDGKNQHGSSYEYKDLQGLTREQATGSGTVTFRLVREAGTIECQGKFENGKGSGTFNFASNPAFVSAMKSRGYDFNEGKYGNINDRLFSATTLNLTTAFVDDLKTGDFGPLTIDDLFKARVFNITPQFMREMKATGFPKMGMEELVKARIFKIDANYVKELSDAGLKNEPFESLVKARIFKIDADFVRQIGVSGFQNKSMEDLVKMRIFKITPEFIKEIQDTGYKNVANEDLVKFRTFKIDGAFIKEIQAEGFNNISVEDLVKMKIFKIDGAFIRKAKMTKSNVNVEELVEMKIGVWKSNVL